MNDLFFESTNLEQDQNHLIQDHKPIVYSNNYSNPLLDVFRCLCRLFVKVEVVSSESIEINQMKIVAD